MKECKKCKTTQPLENFYKNGKYLLNSCKECVRSSSKKRRQSLSKEEKAEYQRKYRESNKEVLSEKSKQYYKKNKCKFQEKYRENREKILASRRKRTNTLRGKYSQYSYNASNRGITFNLSLEDFSKYWQQPCTYCKGDIETIGLDRVESDKGYEIDNVTSCCSICNYMKGSHTLEEFTSHIGKLHNSLCEKGS